MKSNNLQKMRINKELSQSQLARLSGVNLRTLQDFEQGRKPLKNAKGEMIYKLSQALDCTVEELLIEELSNLKPSSRYEKYYNLLSNTSLYDKYYTFPVIVSESKIDMKRIYPTKQSLIYKLHDELKNDSRITAIMLFGSSVTMQCNKDSDIDLAVRLNKESVNKETKNDISEKIQIICNWNADIIWYDRLNKSDKIYHDICKGVQII